MSPDLRAVRRLSRDARRRCGCGRQTDHTGGLSQIEPVSASGKRHPFWPQKGFPIGRDTVTIPCTDKELLRDDLMPSAFPQVLIVGRQTRQEMRPVLAAISSQVSSEQTRHAHDTDAVLRLLADREWFPDLVAVCQSWPDEFSRSDVDRMMGLLPLARWVCCFGVWCESDGRNRTHWPLAVRVPARCAEPRIRREFDVVHQRHRTLPPTASRDEIAAFDLACESPKRDTKPSRLSRNSVIVRSPDRELRRWLQELLRTAGFSLTDELQVVPGTAVLWDVDPWENDTANEVREFCQANPDVPVIATMTLAHPEDIDALTQCGVKEVVAKLVAPPVLLNAIDEVARPERSEGPTK